MQQGKQSTSMWLDKVFKGELKNKDKKLTAPLPDCVMDSDSSDQL